MPQLLLELFSEEIPARMQAQAAKDLERMAREHLAAAGFLPAVGRLTHLRLPETVRLESGVDVGDEITPHYDAMIAKLIARGEDRPAALDRLAAALAATEIAGIDNNLLGVDTARATAQ